MILFIIFSISLFSLNIEAGKMVLKERGKKVFLSKRVILKEDDIYIEFDKGFWNKEKGIISGEGEIYFILKSTTSILKGNAEEGFYDENEEKILLKGIKNIVYNYFVKDSTYTFYITGDNLLLFKKSRKVKLEGEVVGIDFEDYVIRGESMFYDDSKRILRVDPLNNLRKKNNGMEVEGESLIYRIDEEEVFIEGNVSGSITLK
ncbi:MAG: hypothetical protein DRI36_03690 [Caldiserica bacterium]|nr:MAG: hypothetical protein DRI36_03690 [Caldisericota bacterium]